MSDPTKRHHRTGRRPLVRLALAGCLLALGGCGGEAKSSVFDEISRLPTREELVEVALGTFIVPIPLVLESAIERFEPDNLMQVEIELFAIVDPKEKGTVEKGLKRNEGRIRDAVIRVCRNTTRDDLLEAQKATLKSHLLDALQPLLGGQALRRLGVRRVILNEL